METTANVEVHSGIKAQPDSSDVSVPGCQEDAHNNEIVHVPWRMGSERHLGLMRRPEPSVNDMPPPPY